MKKILLALALALALAFICDLNSQDLAQAAEGLITYPTLGVCTSNGVNLRDAPGTQGSAAVGKARKGDRFVILGETKMGGSVWYEIENPGPYTNGLGLNDNLWISGKYISPAFPESLQRTGTVEALVKIYQSFGSTPARMRELLGAPDHEDRRDDIGSSALEAIFGNESLYVHFRDGFLSGVDITERREEKFDEDFMGVRVGDGADEVRKAIGDAPKFDGFNENAGEGMITYEVKNATVGTSGMTFMLDEDGNVSSMTAYYNFWD